MGYNPTADYGKTPPAEIESSERCVLLRRRSLFQVVLAVQVRSALSAQ